MLATLPAPACTRASASPSREEPRPRESSRSRENASLIPHSTGGPDATDPELLSIHDADLATVALRSFAERLTAPLARAAAAACEHQAWFEFGYARQSDYCRERLQRSSRWLRELAGLGRALDRLPPLAAALSGSDGRAPLGQVAACHVARVASEATASAWIAHARRVSVRRLAEDVREASRGGGPPWSAPRDVLDKAEPPSPRVWEDVPPGQEDDEPRVTVRIPLPAPVLAAFEEVLELHRAVCGGEATVASFIEALVADNQAGPAPAELPESTPVRRLGRGVRVERLDATRRDAVEDGSLAAAERCRGWLRHPCVARAWSLVARSLTLRHAGPAESADEADARLREMLEAIGESERLLGRLLATLGRRRAWAVLGFADLQHYAEQRLGLAGSTARDRARIAASIRRYPLLRASYENGLAGPQATLAVLRALERKCIDTAVESEWANRAETTTVRRLRDESRLLRLEMRRRGRRESRDRQRRPLDDGAWRRAMRRAPGETVERLMGLIREAVEDPWEDELLRLRLPATLAGRLSSVLRSAVPEPDLLESLRDRMVGPAGGESSDDGLRSDPDIGSAGDEEAPRTFAANDLPSSRAFRLVFLLSSYALAWDLPDSGPRRPADRIYERDGWRCQAPGCGSRQNLEAHHVVYRSRGGADEPSNVVTLCRFHHQRGEHGGLLRVRGRAPLALTFEVGRQGKSGRFVNDRQELDERPGRPGEAGRPGTSDR